MNNSKAISVLFGVIVGINSTLTALFLGITEEIKLLTATIISFSTSTLLFALITENLFDKKINEIYKSFEKIRNKDFKRVKTDRTVLRQVNPLKGINEEIYGEQMFMSFQEQLMFILEKFVKRLVKIILTQ